MRFRDYVIIFLCLILAASLLFVGQERLNYINAARKEMKLISNEPLENAPPSLAFASVAMGAFRGLLVDVLWMRADKLKMEGQFFDAKQLAEWITVLQPRFAEVWDFQGWNMAYNISVAMPASQPQERWRWVKNGYELLRDQAIVKNPKNIGLYRSLAWIFFHKMGGVSDDVHKYYKLQLALSMKPLIDPQTNEWFDKLAQSPKTWAEITSDAGVVKFVDALKSADPNFTKPGEEFVRNYLAMRQSPKAYAAAFSVVDRFRGRPELVKFDAFAKASELRNTWKLDPAFMVELNRELGPRDYEDPNRQLPLNWEVPTTHAIYWAAMGVKVAEDKSDFKSDGINTDRIVFQGLQDLFRNGKMVIYDTVVDGDANEVAPGQSPPPPRIVKSVFTFQDLRMFDPYDKAIRAIIAKYKQPNGSDEVSIQNGHRNMLTNAVTSFYQSGHERYAQRVYNELRELYPRPEFEVPLAQFVKSQVKDMLQNVTIHDATQMIQGMLRESYFRYALGEDDEAAGRERMAQQIYDVYSATWKDEKVKRVDMPEFSMLRYLAIDSFLTDEMYPPNLRLALVERIKIEKPELIKQFETIAKRLTERARQAEANEPSK